MKDHLLTLAAYHHWAFKVLNEALDTIDDIAYHAPAGLFFGSIHATLNHLLVADGIWYGRVTARPYPATTLDQEIHSERKALQTAITSQAALWCRWIEARDEAELAGELRYTNLSGAALHDPAALILAHVFNHATHHRGQISAAMTQLGYDGPVMDLIYYLRSVPKT